MTDIQFLTLMRRELKEALIPDAAGRYKSALAALELVRIYRKEIEKETRKKLKNENKNKNGS